MLLRHQFAETDHIGIGGLTLILRKQLFLCLPDKQVKKEMKDISSILNSIVYALTDTITRDLKDNENSGISHYKDGIARFLLSQYMRMPDYLRVSFRIMMLLFDTWSIPFTGKLFHRLSHKQRELQVKAWKESKFAFRRDLIKFYESLILFAWYSEDH